MEEQWYNFSNNTAASQVEFSYFSLIVIVLILLPIVAIDCILIVILAIEKTINRNVRFLLGNILIACVVVCAGLCMLLMIDVILSACHCAMPPIQGCRVMFWIVISGAAARLVFMGFYSVVVFMIVKVGAKKVHFIGVVIAVLAAWLACLIINSAILSPDVLDIAIVDSISCAPHAKGPSTYAYSIIYLLLFALSSFILTIVMPIITLVYVKRNSVSGSKKSLYRAMAFFGLFLLVGNAGNFIGQAVPVLLTIFVSSDNTYEISVAVNYILGVFIILSLIPTPIFIIALFKPVRKQFVRLFMRLSGRTSPDTTAESKTKPNSETADKSTNLS